MNLPSRFAAALSATVLGALALSAVAATPAADGEAAIDHAAKALKIDRTQIRPSPVPGLLEVQHGHEFGYVTSDGKYLLRGDLVNIDTGEEITEQRRRQDRIASLKTLGDDSTILFAPNPPIATKYTVTVFTDVDCGYCRKLHSEISEYNKLGIAVRYAFFPRTGPNTDSWHRAEAVWCSSDRRAALTKAKLGQNINAKSCPNPVERDFKLGVDLGVRGTPMIFMPNGDIVPGYVPPEDLAESLADASSAKALGAKLDPLAGGSP